MDDDFQPEVSAPAKDEGLEILAKSDPKPIAESAMPDVNDLKEEQIETSDEGLAVDAQLEEKPISEPEEVEILNASPKRPIPAIPVPTTPVPTTPVTTTSVPATPEIAAAHAVLKKEELKVKDAIENYSLPPLPSRDRIASQEIAKTPSVLTPGSPAAIQSPISPRYLKENSRNTLSHLHFTKRCNQKNLGKIWQLLMGHHNRLQELTRPRE